MKSCLNRSRSAEPSALPACLLAGLAVFPLARLDAAKETLPDDAMESSARTTIAILLVKSVPPRCLPSTSSPCGPLWLRCYRLYSSGPLSSQSIQRTYVYKQKFCISCGSAACSGQSLSGVKEMVQVSCGSRRLLWAKPLRRQRNGSGLLRLRRLLRAKPLRRQGNGSGLLRLPRLQSGKALPFRPGRPQLFPRLCRTQAESLLCTSRHEPARVTSPGPQAPGPFSFRNFLTFQP